jgi:chorismate mutase
MSVIPKYYLIAAEALPEIFLRVAEAKRLFETGEAPTAREAARQAGISRSAYYKYKDSISPFYDMTAGKIITFNIMLKDRPGILSSVLSIFADSGANILTLNQSLPSNGCAAVTISAETSEMLVGVSELLQTASEAYGVVKIEILAG